LGGGKEHCGYVLEIVVICQLFASHDTFWASEKCHLWLSFDDTLLHGAIWATAVIDETSDVALLCVDDHALVKLHQVVALYISLAHSEQVSMSEKR